MQGRKRTGVALRVEGGRHIRVAMRGSGWGRTETFFAHEIPDLCGLLTRLSGNDPLFPVHFGV